MKRTTIVFFLLLVMLSNCALADSFGSGANTFDIQFVTIGNPNNLADSSVAGAAKPGAVNHLYRMAKFEISAAMVDKANARSAETGNPLGITRANTANTDTAAYFIAWYEAASFVNWLNTSTGAVSAYKLNVSGNVVPWDPGDVGYDPNNKQRNSLAKYFLPTDDEWYKAAYYNPQSGTYYQYATGSNTTPTRVSGGTAANTAVYSSIGNSTLGPAITTSAGGLSAYGTMAQEGNVWEWLEDPVDSDADLRYYRGEAWHNVELTHTRFDRSGALNAASGTLGIRVASTVPEPSTLLLAAVGLPLLWRRRR